MVKKRQISNILIAILAILILVFLYLPIAIVVIYSFNADTVNCFPMNGFSLKWFRVMAENKNLIQALGHSLQIAVVSTLVACLLGVPGAYAMYRYHFPGKEILNRIVMLPLILPGILTGIAMLTFFKALGVNQGMLAVVLGHSTFLIATVLPQVYDRLKRMDHNIIEAAEDLGATGIQTFVHVILPNVKTAIVSSALLSFTLSMDEIPVTYFLNGVFSTLPIQIWGMTRNGITPEVNAISSIIFAVSLVAILISNLLNKEN
ncbi:ABC transporter permease [Roseburia sp. 831b]|uniref:ABC transporter permease n=1 Tax=Roseburia sp. 831b TaxID=1261635 RepID=UPI0009522627|nr:ABC transporter permease [Roseburia sp. 831b]WVK72759.1 ABC transporter permease [Roseburia sp. 831b]